MTFEKVAKIIADNMDMDINTIKMESSFEEMELDSLDVVEVVMEIEETFDVNIEVEEDIKTVGDLVNLIDKAK
ncbi:MAG: acyl carrier protein [Anaerovoracaceae bacterium]|jgi:acyl carrier protein